MKRSIKSMIMTSIAAFVFALSGCKWFEPTQAELFAEYAQIAKSSREATNWYLMINQGEVRTTTNENGACNIAMYEGDEYVTCYFKEEDSYYRYLNGGNSNVLYKTSASQQDWERAKTSIFLKQDEELGNVFTSKSLEEYETNFTNTLINAGAALPVSPEVSLSKEDGKLTLSVSVEFKFVNNDNTQHISFDVICSEGKIEEIRVVTFGGGVDTYRLHYQTNQGMMPSQTELDNAIVSGPLS